MFFIIVLFIFILEDTYFFKILYAFNQFLKTYGSHWTGINLVSIAGRPGCKTTVIQRIFRPAIISPAKIAIHIFCSRVPTDPNMFCRWRKGKTIWIFFCAASVPGAYLSLLMP